MRVVETAIPGVLVLEIEPRRDARGYFARTWEAAVLAERGFDARVAECSIAFNETRGTLRGLHYQAEPYGEAKTVRCTAGAIWDVAVDLRPDSTTRYRWFGTELSATNGRGLYMPPGCAHGYVTLTDGAEVVYQISVPHRARAARGHRYDDPAFGIEWPVPVVRISDRDAAYPLLR